MANRILGMGDIWPCRVSTKRHGHRSCQGLGRKIKVGGKFDMNDFSPTGTDEKHGQPVELDGQTTRTIPTSGIGRQCWKMLRKTCVAWKALSTPRHRSNAANQNSSKPLANARSQLVPACKFKVNRMLAQFEQMQSMMKKLKGGGMMKMLRGLKGMMRCLPSPNSRAHLTSAFVLAIPSIAAAVKFDDFTASLSLNF